MSCYGRVHPEARATLVSLAKSAARRHGVIDVKGFLARLYRNISVEIWRRVASMVYDCMPKLRDSESEPLHGRGPTIQRASESDVAKVVCTDAAM